MGRNDNDSTIGQAVANLYANWIAGISTAKSVGKNLLMLALLYSFVATGQLIPLAKNLTHFTHTLNTAAQKAQAQATKGE